MYSFYYCLLETLRKVKMSAKDTAAPRALSAKPCQGFMYATPNPVFGVPGVTVDPVLPVLEDVAVVVAHVGPKILLALRVTVLADKPKIRPFKFAPEFSADTPFWAIMVPIKDVVVSRVAELPILHHTLQGSPPVTEEPGDVISDDTDLKIQTPEPVKFKLPLRVKLLVEQ